MEATEHVTELSLGGGAGAHAARPRGRGRRRPRGARLQERTAGEPPDWYGERPTHPQLLAYLAALGADVVALATVNLTAREVRFSGVAATGDVLPRGEGNPGGDRCSGRGLARTAGGWVALVERLIRAFLAGEARVDPAPGALRLLPPHGSVPHRRASAPEPGGFTDEADE